MALTPEEVNEVLALRHELRHVEFKRSGDRADKGYVATVARAVMAMGNLPDGGHVVLGVAEADGQLAVTGLSKTQLAQWLDHDEVADAVGRFSDPVPTIGLQVIDLQGREILDIHVDPFLDTPYLCRRDWPGVLQDGRMYVRRVGKAETANPTHHELREVLDRAAAQRVRNLLAVLGAASVDSLRLAPAAEASYAQERDAVGGDSDRMAFETLGHWDVKVHPADYQADRLGRSELLSILEAATVRLRGWPVPFIPNDELLQGQHYIGGETDDARHVEAWRFFRSGQFYERRAFSAETPEHNQAGQMFVDIWDVVFHVTEIYAFATRLAESLPGIASMTINLALDGMFEAELRSEPARELNRTYRTDQSRIEIVRTLPVSDLLSRPLDLALEVALGLLQGFGLSIGREVMADYQHGLLNRGHR